MRKSIKQTVMLGFLIGMIVIIAASLYAAVLLPYSYFEGLGLITDVVLLALLATVTVLLVNNMRRRRRSEKLSTELMAARELAEESSRSKSKFLARMSHEIRTPMNGIIGIAQIQLQRNDLPPEIDSAFRKIYFLGNELLGIINDILDLSKVESGKFELHPMEYELPSLIHDVVQLNMTRLSGKPIKLLLEISEQLPMRLYGDELRLKQILTNLMSNAVKYTDKGQITLAVSHAEMDSYVELLFSVEDTGQGIKPEDVKNIFSQYARFNPGVNAAVEGTGLGLAITQHLVEMMDGSIDIQSEYGVGSKFTVRVRQQSVENSPPIGAEIISRIRNYTFINEKKSADLNIVRERMPYGRVLIVDDSETNLYVAEGLLRPYRLNIATVDSGFKAIQKIREGNFYDIIFMDHMMPYMDGIETTKRLRELGYRGAVVALTANALAGSEKMFLQNGFDGFISKPIDITQMDALLNQHIRDKHAGVLPGLPDADSMFFEVFTRDVKRAILELNKTARSGELKEFTTAAHAIKSALAYIGNGELFALALALEKAGTSGDTLYIGEHVEPFVTAIEALAEGLEGQAPDRETV